jgi:hypothetical protein
MVHNFFLQLIIGQRFLQNLREVLENLVHVVVNIQLREGEGAKVALGVHLLAAAHLTPALGQEAGRQCRRLTPYRGGATCLMMMMMMMMKMMMMIPRTAMDVASRGLHGLHPNPK